MIPAAMLRLRAYLIFFLRKTVASLIALFPVGNSAGHVQGRLISLCDAVKERVRRALYSLHIISGHSQSDSWLRRLFV